MQRYLAVTCLAALGSAHAASTAEPFSLTTPDTVLEPAAGENDRHEANHGGERRR